MIEVLDLPSKRKPYSTEANLFVKPYTLGDLEDFARSISSLPTFYEKMLEGIAVTNMDKRDITLDDFYYLMTIRKLRSIGDSAFTAVRSCSKCKTNVTTTFNITEIDFDELSTPTAKAKITVDLIEGTKQDLVISPLTIGRYIDVLSLEVEKEIASNESLKKDQHTKRRKYLFAAIIEGDIEENYKFLTDKMKLSELYKIEEAFKMMHHGIKPIKGKCDVCKNEIDIRIERRDTIVSPFRGSRNSFEDEIEFL